MRVFLGTPPYILNFSEDAVKETRDGLSNLSSDLIKNPYDAPNLGLLYIAQKLIDDGHDVKFYDGINHDNNFDNVKKILKEFAPELVGVTAWTPTLYLCLKLLSLAKEYNPNTYTVLGGIHPSCADEEVIQKEMVDFVVRGEGEKTLPELIQTLAVKGDVEKIKGITFKKNERIIRTEERPFINDLGNLRPAWEIVDWEKYDPPSISDEGHTAYVETSRGCFFHCSFCALQKFWKGSLNLRDPKDFVNEIEYLAKNYNVKMAVLTDELPTSDRKRWETILDLLIEKNIQIYFSMQTRASDIVRDAEILWKYKKAGVLEIFIGVEGSTQTRLQLFKKDRIVSPEISKEALRLLREADIVSQCSFILGMLDETQESVAQTIDLAINYYDPDLLYLFFIMPWPFGDLFESLKPYIKIFDYSRYTYVYPIVEPLKIDRETLYNMVAQGFQKFYFKKAREWFKLPKTIRRTHLLNLLKRFSKGSSIIFTKR